MREKKWIEGSVYLNKRGEAFEYLGYEIRRKAKYHLVRFISSNNYQFVHTAILNNLSKVRDLSSPYICDIGYATGTREHPMDYRENLDAYLVWCAMLERCYGDSERYKSYKGVEVDSEWHNYTNFREWYERKSRSYVNFSELHLCLDKDLFSIGLEKKIYSPRTCCFMPKAINSLLSHVDFSIFNPRAAQKIRDLLLLTDEHVSELELRVKSVLYKMIQEYADKYCERFGVNLYERFI